MCPSTRNSLDLGVRFHDERHLIEGPVRIRLELCRTRPEADGVAYHELTLLVRDPRLALVGAAVVVLDAVDRLLLVRALVVRVRHAVVIVVGVLLGAAVAVVIGVAILRDVEALVALVIDAVVVPVVRGRRVASRPRTRGRSARRSRPARRSPGPR